MPEAAGANSSLPARDVNAEERIGTKVTSPRAVENSGGSLGEEKSLSLSLGFEFYAAISEFNGIFDIVTFVLLADLLGFFLHEGGEGFDVAGDILSGLLFGGDQSVVKALDLLALALIDGMEGKWL